MDVVENGSNNPNGVNGGGKHGQVVIERRRALVRRLMAMGQTVREIAAGLPALNEIDAATGQPWSRGTVGNDYKAVRAEWREAHKAELDEHRAEELAVLREHRRQAWNAREFAEVRLATLAEMKLLGTAAPEKFAPTDPTGQHEYSGLLDSKLARIAASCAAGEDAGEPDATGTG